MRTVNCLPPVCSPICLLQPTSMFYNVLLTIVFLVYIYPPHNYFVLSYFNLSNFKHRNIYHRNICHNSTFCSLDICCCCISTLIQI